MYLLNEVLSLELSFERNIYNYYLLLEILINSYHSCRLNSSEVVYSNLAIRINRLLAKYLSLLTFMEHTHLRFYYTSFWKLRLLADFN